MNALESMLQSHPKPDAQRAADYATVIETLAECTEICVSCADACLGEAAHAGDLRRCIRTNLDCSEVCAATERLLVRQTETPNALVHALLHACVVACELCADECERHASAHRHCRICADTCRRCQERCNLLLGEITSSGVESDEDLDLS